MHKKVKIIFSEKKYWRMIPKSIIFVVKDEYGLNAFQSPAKHTLLAVHALNNHISGSVSIEHIYIKVVAIKGVWAALVFYYCTFIILFTVRF